MGADLVVLLHGQPGSSRDWALVRPLLGDTVHGLRVIAPERPGYDDRQPAGGFWHNAEAVTALLDQERAERAVLVGYSWGGGVALATAVRHPARVAALALLAPVGTRAAVTRTDRLMARPRPSAVFAWAMALAGTRTLRLTARMLGSRLPTGELRRLRREGRATNPRPYWRSWAVEQRALIEETPGLEARLPEVRAPAIVLVGRRDTAVPPTAARAVAAGLQHAECREVDAGHLLLLEVPTVVADAIRDSVVLALARRR